MPQLDTRTRDVLLILLQTTEPVSMKQVADRLSITPRMIRPNLDIIEKWLQSHEANLIRKPNYGISIQASDLLKSSLLRELTEQENYLLYLSTAERIDALLLMLLGQGENPIQADAIESKLGISRPTLYKDLNKVQNRLQEHGLDLTYKARTGYQVIGSEACWREALVHFVLNKFGLVPFFAICIDSDARFDLKTTSNLNLLNKLMVEIFQSLDLSGSYGMIKKMEHTLQQKFTDMAFASLVFHLALTMARIEGGYTIQPANNPTGIDTSSREVKIVRQISAEIHQKHAVELNEEEIGYFAQQVLGAKIQYSLAEMTDLQQKLANPSKTDHIVDSIIHEASLYLHPYLKVDRQLIRALTYHIQIATNRLRYGMPIYNPLQEAVELRYPHIMRVARKSVGLFEEKVNKKIPQSEIAYIAMHLGAAMERLRPYLNIKKKLWVACAEGTATAWLLVSRIQAEFPEVEVLEVMSTLDLLQTPPHPGEIDALLTTVPVEIPGILALEVSPLLNETDKEHICEALNITAMRKAPVRKVDTGQGVPLTSLVFENTIQPGVKAENWEQVVEICGKLLMDVHSINHRYIQSMKEVIFRFGPYVVFTPGVALLHARPEDGVYHMCMSLITLDPPVPFHHPHNDPVSIAIALAVSDNFSHLRALAQLANLMSDRHSLERIKNARSRREILQYLIENS